MLFWIFEIVICDIWNSFLDNLKLICQSLDYTVVGAFMEIFKTKSKEVASCCMEMFNYPLPSVSVNSRKCKFLQKFSAFENNVVIVLIALSVPF